MKFIIVLSVTLGCAFANYGGHFLADSPDVAAAKLAHFEEKAKAAAAVGAAPDYVTSYYLNYYKNYNGGNSPAAAISVLPSGYLADTPEVAAAKASFLAEHAKASYAARANSPASQAYNSDYYNAYTSNNYNNAPAAISVLPSGYLADTPEVASAKASFLAEHAKASYAARANSPATQAYNNDYNNAYTSNNYNNAPAAITVLPSGFLADTPEVAAAKTAHFAEQARAAYAAGASSTYAIPQTYNNDYYNAYTSNNAPAAISVLPSGYLADTPEVAAAKTAHFAEQARAAYAAGASSTYAIPQTYNNDYYTSNNYNNAPAAITVLPSGYLADTPEVAAAKVSFLAEHAKASYAARANTPATQAYNNDYYNAYTSNNYNNNYNNAPATITVLPSGFLADTPEVAAAKTAHFAEQARAAYAAGASSTYAIPQTYNNDYYNAYTSNNAPAAISVLPSGYLADTPEVAAAKASFLAEHAKASYAARANSPATQAYNNDYYNAYTSNNNNNAVAAITVLPSGFLADTPEVAAAKTAHFAEQARAAYAAGASSTYAIPFNYNSAAINVLPSGYLADTPEVAAAKASFYAEFAKASSSSSASSNPYYSPYYTWNGYSWVANQ